MSKPRFNMSGLLHSSTFCTSHLVLCLCRALSLKAKFAKAAQRLMKVAAAPSPQTKDGLAAVDEMSQSVSDFVALVPPVVVKQVRSYELKMRPPPPPPPAPPIEDAPQPVELAS